MLAYVVIIQAQRSVCFLLRKFWFVTMLWLWMEVILCSADDPKVQLEPSMRVKAIQITDYLVVHCKGDSESVLSNTRRWQIHR
jgi:hypothetical protein